MIMQPHPILDSDPAYADYRRLAPEEFTALAQNAGEASALAYVAAREQRIKIAEGDPLRCGFELPHWRDVRHLVAQKDETYILGANDSGKTELTGKLAGEWLIQPGMKVLCIAQNEGASKQFQQPAVYKYLPLAARKFNSQSTKRRSTVTKINYSQSGGFTEGTFVLPNKSQCWFKTVEQYQRDPNSFEGPAYHLVIIDEPAPVQLVQTLGFRAAKVSGKIVFCFTAVHGFDAVCAAVLTGARIVKTLPMNWDWFYQERDSVSRSNVDTSVDGEVAAGHRPALHGGPNPEIQFPELNLSEVQVEGCPPGHMPYIMQPLDFNKGVIFTWAHWNPFPPRAKFNKFLTRTADKCVGKGKRISRVRLFGWAEKITGCQFPSFKVDVHVLPHEKIEAMLKAKKLTSYMSDDPAQARSHFLIWKGVDAQSRNFVFDESPRIADGEWVTAEGEKGEGQNIYAGAGVSWYKRHIRDREREHGQESFRRKGDPRAFATQAAAAEGGTSLFEIYAQPDAHHPDDEDTGPMLFEPAKVRQRISMEVEVINDAFAYDDKLQISIENEPKLYISDRCQNLIRSILNWSPDQGEDSPWKDPIDAFRYLFDEPMYFNDPNVPDVVGGRGWG